MSQIQSITLKHLSLPTHTFVPSKFKIPLNRNFSLTPRFTFSSSLSVKCYHPNLVQPKPFPPLPQRPPCLFFNFTTKFNMFLSKATILNDGYVRVFSCRIAAAKGVRGLLRLHEEGHAHRDS